MGLLLVFDLSNTYYRVSSWSAQGKDSKAKDTIIGAS
jgi:hypothetical protein